MSGKPTPSNRETSPERDPLVGKQLGDYKLDRLIATGGMARIYQGTDQKLARTAAIKVLQLNDGNLDDTLAKRFQREARAVAALEHPNIISLFQYGEQDGYYFLAMKYIKGHDLAQEIKHLKRRGKKIDLRRALEILEQIAGALDYAHTRGVIHRDVKPSNILLAEDGQAILTDFGLTMHATNETTLGTAFGTPRYISPEQATASNKAVPQSDVYSLGVIFYEILTGAPPFTGDTPMEIALNHITTPPPPPRSRDSSIPEAVERQVLKALSKEPTDRHKTALEFIHAVQQAYGYTSLIPEGLLAGPVTTQPRSPEAVTSTADTHHSIATANLSRPQRRRPLLVWFVSIFLVALVGVAAFLLITSNSTSTPGPAIVLIYDDANFTVVNSADYDLNVQRLTFIRGVDGSGGDDYSGDRVPGDTIASNSCYRVSLQGRQTAPPPQCSSNTPIGEVLQDQLRLFWRSETSTDALMSSFEVQYNGQTVVRCNTVSRGGADECRFDWPAPPTVPAR
jgi:serine/threonine protein kinase